jgi:hypothetical protein
MQSGAGCLKVDGHVDIRNEAIAGSGEAIVGSGVVTFRGIV